MKRHSGSSRPRHCSGGPSVRWRPASQRGSRASASQWSVVIEPSWFAIGCLCAALIAGRAGAAFWCRANSRARSVGWRFKVRASNRWLCPPAVRKRTACVGCSPKAAPACGSCLRGFGGIEVRVEERFAPCAVFCGKQFVPRPVWRGKLALMVRKQALLHQPPNPSIERTSSSKLRLLPAAAHVQR